MITGRSSKQTVFKPLPSKTQKRGAPGGTESLAEILPHLEKHVDKKTAVACSDAGAGLRAAWSSMAVPAATARHNLDEFTPVKTLRVKDLTPGQRRTLAKNAAAKKPAAAFTPQKQRCRIVGGDNQAESAISHGKRQLRRVNLLGRSSPRNAHIDLLCARRLLRVPGLTSVLHALAVYRKDRAGCIGCCPDDFGDSKKDRGWLLM